MNFISSFFDNIKDKTTNPFFGTLIFVWLIRNWELVYTIFNFDKNYNLEAKKGFIRNYYKDYHLGEELFMNILISFGLMLLGYALIIISRLIVNVTDHNIIPWMNNKTVSKLVVNKDRFETVKKTRDEYFTKILDFEEQVVELEQKNSLLKKINIENESKISENAKIIAETTENLKHATKRNGEFENRKIEDARIIKELNTRFNNITADYNEVFSLMLKHINRLDISIFSSYSDINIPLEIKNAYLTLNRDTKKEESDINLNGANLPSIDLVFFDYAQDLAMGSDISFNGLYINYYIKIGLIEFRRDNEENERVDGYNADSLQLTVLGRIVDATKNIYFELKENELIE